MADLVRAFTEAAKQEFAFLGRFGFAQDRIVSSGAVRTVSYRSPSVSVELLFGPPEFEPELVVSHLQEGTRLSSGGLISAGALSMPEPTAHPRWLGAEEKIKNHLHWFALMLQAADARLLAGDEEFHCALARKLELTLTELREKERVQRVHAEAQKAWQAKRYQDVIHHYDSIAQQLGPLERKRLDYAREQVQSQ